MQSKPDSLDADFAIIGATIVTMDAERRVLTDGALAVSGKRIIWVGRADELDGNVNVRERVDGRGRLIAPGFINAHVHVTGDPLTRHYMPDDLNEPDRLFTWVMPRYFAHTEQDEELSATYASLQLLKSGTTTFVEAGTVLHLDHVVTGLRKTGIRARVGAWVEGRAFDDGASEAQLIDQAIKTLEDETAKYPDDGEALIAAWPILVGHNTNPDAVWRAAREIARENKLRITAHMSPYASDPEWFLEQTGRRPVKHLEEIGVLGPELLLTHMTHIDAHEAEAVARSGTSVIFCPFASLKGAFGVAAHGRYDELVREGVKLAFATDGYDCEILPVARLGATILKDLAEDVGEISALKALEKITCEAAEALGLSHEIGSLEPGKKADMVSFDTNHIQWRPLLAPLDQLLWSADARSIADVWVDGARVIRDQQAATLDEDKLLADVQQSAERIIRDAKLPFRRNTV